MDWHQLAKLKVTELREKAHELPDIGAVSGLHKEELLEVLAKHLGIEKPHRVVDGTQKRSIKDEIRALKVKRDEALAAHDSKELKRVRRQIHKRKRALRRASHLIT